MINKRIQQFTILITIILITTQISVSSISKSYPINNNQSKPVVLLTGFEPFGTHEINPSQIIAETLNSSIIEETILVGIVLPVNFTESIKIVTKAIEDSNPIVIINLGLAEKSRLIRIENIGLNLKRDMGEPIWKIRKLKPDTPIILKAKLPTKNITKEIQKENIPVRQSYHAGLYVCNALMYNVLHYIHENNLSIIAGFIHIPLLSTQDPNGLELQQMIDATVIAIKQSIQEY